MRGEATKNVKVNESFKYFLFSVKGKCYFLDKNAAGLDSPEKC